MGHKVAVQLLRPLCPFRGGPASRALFLLLRGRRGVFLQHLVVEQAAGLDLGVEQHTDLFAGKGDPNHRWYGAASRIAAIVGGGVLQHRARKEVCVGGLTLVLYGRLDALLAGGIYDIKFSKGYDRGKYFDSTQHPTYLELVPEAEHFTYLVSNGTDVWQEKYRREETPSIFPVISDFLDWLTARDLLGLYQEKWLAK